MSAVAVDLSPPRVLPWAEELPLTAHVRWSHRAAVARWKRAQYVEGGEWLLVEGVEKRSGWRPNMGRDIREDNLPFNEWLHDDPFWHREPRPQDPNKTVVVWPEDGSGYLFGLVRRGIGISEPARKGGGWIGSDMYDEGDPGGFAAEGFVHLYAVKGELRGVGYWLVPTWACRLARDDEPKALDINGAPTPYTPGELDNMIEALESTGRYDVVGRRW